MRRTSLELLADIRRRYPLQNPIARLKANRGDLERLAVWITDHVGTMGFFLIILTWTLLWLGWNFLAPPELKFDRPMGFVFWLFISNMIQILLMPLLMVGQNIQGRQSEARAEHDLEVNIKAGAEIEVILRQMEQQTAFLVALLDRHGIRPEDVPSSGAS